MSNEKILALPGGRQLAYEHSGAVNSTKLVLFFHGAFGVGSASAEHILPTMAEKEVHYIAPTLPGWGNSSSVPKGSTFAACLTSDITTLLDHLRPDRESTNEDLTIYVQGGSYGTAAAQILYGASYDVFPYGRRIAGMLLLGPFPPFHCYPDYAKGLTWQNWFAVGPPARHLPFQPLQRLAKRIVGPKFRDMNKVEVILRKVLFDKMDEQEREKFRKWREERGYAEGQLEREFAVNASRSVARSWDGFLQVVEVLHADWGFCPSTLDNAHSKPVMIVSSDKDSEASPIHAQWLVKNYKNARLRKVEGGHISCLFEMNDIQREFYEYCG